MGTLKKNNSATKKHLTIYIYIFLLIIIGCQMKLPTDQKIICLGGGKNEKLFFSLESHPNQNSYRKFQTVLIIFIYREQNFLCVVKCWFFSQIKVGIFTLLFGSKCKKKLRSSFPFLKEDMERLWSFIFQPWHAFQRCDFSFLTFNLNSSHQNLYQDNIPTTNSAIHLSSFHTKCVWCQTRPLFIVADHFEC